MLILSSSHRPHPSSSSIAVCGEMISCSSQAHNIGVIFNQSFSMIHVMSICKSSFFHLHNIGLIRKFITFEAFTLLIHAFVMSKLDKSLLYGLPMYLLKRLQHSQNIAVARLLTFSPKYVHIIPMLKQLHWLYTYALSLRFFSLLSTPSTICAPVYIKDLIKQYQPVHELRSSHKNLLVT